MSDQNLPDPTAETAINEQESAALSQRLASLSAPRPGVSSIWQRREALTAAPTSVDDHTRDEAQTAEATPTSRLVAAAPRPPAPTTSSSIGRLTRVTAAELWPDVSAMSSWVTANAEALSELTGVEELRFQAPAGGTVLGTTAGGGAICVVCEVGPSSDEGLGALLRTAAVQDGGTVVWLNGGPSDSHVAALSWLNRATPPRFFLAKATGVRIDGSASAPMFELLVRPPRGADSAEEPVDSAAETTDAPQRRVEDHVPEG